MLASLFAQEGAYRHKMGLRRFPAAEFYAPSPAGAEIRAEKEAIYNRTGERHMLSSPAGHEAAMEFAQVLGLRAKTSVKPDDSGRHAFNRWLGLSLEPDLLLVHPPDWSLGWANVCFPSRWSLEGKSNRPLTWIHEPVPGLNRELDYKIATFFSRLASGEGWRRANWGLSASALRNQHPEEPIPTLEATTSPNQIFLRVEDQHLLKLPTTGAIAFGIRTVHFPWNDVTNHPAIANSLSEKLRTMSPEVAQYKGLDRFIPSIPGERYPHFSTDVERPIQAKLARKPRSITSGSSFLPMNTN